ncbi:MAG TPA: uroporphyrinogen-III synthase [Gammaproteobacteria bacterium]|nr:uroporphyrinogen-III synthase [Gammaproteobacteria bacterium]
MSSRPFRVLLTRPQLQNEVFSLQLQAEGYETVLLSVLETKPLPDSTLLQEQIAHLANYQWAIFVSQAAVQMSAAFIHKQWPQFPPTLRIAAIGQGTAEALRQAALPAALYPASNWNSEGLLALPDFQNMRNLKVALFCGAGGRELLATTLQKRGAEVNRFLSYQRVLPELDLSPYLELLRHQQIAAMIATSVEGLANLKKLFIETEWTRLRKIPLVLISERIMIQAKAFGFTNCFLAKAASPLGLLQALNQIRNEQCVA